MNDEPNSLTWDDIDLAEFRRSFKVGSWILSIISGVVTVLGRPGRGASQVEKSLRLNWATQFLTVAYDGVCSPNVSVRREFPSAPCLAGKKKSWWQLASWCWNRARRLTCFLSASVTIKTCNSAHGQTPLSNGTIDSVLHREVCRAKDLSAPYRRKSPLRINHQVPVMQYHPPMTSSLPRTSWRLCHKFHNGGLLHEKGVIDTNTPL